MDKRKLIGTIIGVTMFGLLIVGATFAWLTFTVNVTNGIYNGTTEEFVFYYQGGTAINSVLPILAAPTSSNVDKRITISVSKTSASSTGEFYIKLNSTTNTSLTTDGVIKYAVCSGTSSASNCTGSLTTGQTGVLKTGTVTTGGTESEPGMTELYSTTEITTTTTYFWIYFWMDAETIQNSHLGQTYAGYVFADATQN